MCSLAFRDIKKLDKVVYSLLKAEETKGSYFYCIQVFKYNAVMKKGVYPKRFFS